MHAHTARARRRHDVSISTLVVVVVVVVVIHARRRTFRHFVRSISFRCRNVTHANAPTSLSCVCTRKWSPTDERSRFRNTPSRWRVRLRADANLARACDANGMDCDASYVRAHSFKRRLKRCAIGIKKNYKTQGCGIGRIEDVWKGICEICVDVRMSERFFLFPSV